MVLEEPDTAKENEPVTVPLLNTTVAGLMIPPLVVMVSVPFAGLPYRSVAIMVTGKLVPAVCGSLIALIARLIGAAPVTFTCTSLLVTVAQVPVEIHTT